MLRWRLLSAAALITLFLSLMALDFRQALGAPPGAWLLPWLLLIAVLATEEVLSLLANKNLRPIQWPVYLGVVAVIMALSWPIWSQLLGISTSIEPQSLFVLTLSAAAVLVIVAEMWRFEGPGQHIVHIALAFFATMYVGVLGGVMILLRLHDGDNARGLVALLSMLVVVKSGDVGAYAFGRTLGANKLTPKLSPGKTIEGAIGGVAAACVASWLFFRFAAPQIDPTFGSEAAPTWARTIVYGLVLAIAGMIGDLAESLLKRDMQRKDSSTWLPGLGGVLDVIDALLVGGPAAYLCWQLGLI